MPIFSIIFSLLKTTKATNVVIITVVLSLCIGLYIKGRFDGKELAELSFLKEKEKWEKISISVQTAHARYVESITSEYTKKIEVLNDQVKKLKQNPIIVEKIVEQYIPSTQQCDINKGFVELHNRSAEGKSLDAPVVNPNEKTDISLGAVGTTVAQNYYNCNSEIEKLKALQKIILDFQTAQEKIK